jgi:CRP-like cAMP-binding protein
LLPTIQKYFGFWFWIDFAAVLPDLILAFGPMGSSRDLLQLLKLIRIYRLLGLKVDFTLASDLTYYQTFIVLLKMLVILHWIACSYWWLSVQNGIGTDNIFCKEDEDTRCVDGDLPTHNLWVPPDELRSAGIVRQYTYAFFWALTHVFGIGRDVEPRLLNEYWYSNLILPIGFKFHIDLISSVSSTLESVDRGANERSQKVRRCELCGVVGLVWFGFGVDLDVSVYGFCMNPGSLIFFSPPPQMSQIKQHLKKRNVKKDLQKSIVEYYEHLHAFQLDTVAEDGVLQDLHNALNLELHIELYHDLISNIPMFEPLKDEECLIDIIENVYQRLCIPGETIIRNGSFGTAMFVIVKGRVRIERDGKTVAMLEGRGQVFGQRALLLGTPTNASCISDTYTELLVLDKADFVQIQMEYPIFYRTMNKMLKINTIQSPGWAKIRAIIMEARVVTRIFDREYDFAETLLKPRREEHKAIRRVTHS